MILTPENQERTIFALTWTPAATQTVTLHLKDDAGRENQYPPEFNISLLPNLRPELKVVFPSRDVKATPLEELSLEGTAWDDFGIEEYGIILGVTGKKPQVISLGKTVAGQQTVFLTHLCGNSNFSM